MADPTTTLAERFAAALGAAFGTEHASADPVIRRSAQPQFGDYQANVAMALGKKLGRPPREVATAIVDHLDVVDVCSAVEIAGPGFVNLTLSDDFLASSVSSVAADERLGVPASPVADRVVLDYSHPNVAREMHVGHLRSTVIGDALGRFFEFLGHTVVRQNHLGDWGRNFGMLIEHLLDVGEEEAAHELSVGDLTRFYQEANAKLTSDPEFEARAQQRVVLLQSGDERSLAMWRVLVEESKRYFSRVYELLDVKLTEADIAGESFYNPHLADVADELERLGLARENDGALCVFPPGFTNRDGDPAPLIVRRGYGGYGYEATDLAAVRYRAKELRADRIIYVVDAGQSQHLAMVFAVAAMAGWLDHARVEHAPFGLVLGADGKRFRARSGENVKLIALLEESIVRARAVVDATSRDLEADEKDDVARSVGIGALKYADLSSDRVKDYVFDFDRMLAMDGNTGPYLQYAVARIRSIFRRVETEGGPAASGTRQAPRLEHAAERALAVELLSFEGALRSAVDFLQPHRLCTYLFELASAFTTFYENCPVLRAENETQRASRLLLCDVTARTLALGLDLLGIESPERM